MLVFASGRERTQAQWQALLSKAGFDFTRAIPVGGLSGLVEATVALTLGLLLSGAAA